MPQTNLSNTKNEYDVLIVGGGIVGAGIFRDLALHGMSCLLVDKRDFASQTSQNSSKMFHGGIRYLENYDFGLVWEALHEKNFWLKNTPHLCIEKPFCMPVFKESKDPLWLIAIGLKLYDFLSGFKNSPSKILFPDKTTKLIPQLKTKGLSGSGIYYDAIVDDSKITLECIYDGLLEKGNHALNYTEIVDLKQDNDLCEAVIQDTFSGNKKTIKAHEVVFATGPFTDKLLSQFSCLKWTPKLLPSKGSHIWIERNTLDIENPMVLQTKDGRIIFVIPHHDSILVGTTEKVITGDYFDIRPDGEEITYLLNTLREYFTTATITEKNILSSYSGVRPLVKISESQTAGKTARNHKIFNPFKNIHVIVGGKLTTFRTMGQKISKIIVKKSGKTYSKNITKRRLRQLSTVLPFDYKKEITEQVILDIIDREMPKTFQDIVARRLSIPSKKHWRQKTDFDKFFLSILPKIQGKIKISENDILNFPN